MTPHEAPTAVLSNREDLKGEQGLNDNDGLATRAMSWRAQRTTLEQKVGNSNTIQRHPLKTQFALLDFPILLLGLECT